MRASRAYIAGFGTAGSLLAGAAVVFVLASAVVAFRGWPQVASQATPARVALVHVRGGGVSDASRRLRAAVSTAVASRTAGGSTVAGPATRTGSGSQASSRGAGRTAHVFPQPLAHTPQAPATIAPSTPPVHSSPPTSCLTCVIHLPPVTAGTATTLAQNVTATLGGTVATTGQVLGTTVTNLTGQLAKGLTGSPLAGTVQQAGQVLGNTLTGTTQALGSLVGGLGAALAGAH